jgi:hypothetical protein
MPADQRQTRSTTQWLMACLARLMFALFVTGGALPAGGPSAVHGFNIVEEDERPTQEREGVDARAVRQTKRSTNGPGQFALLEVPSVLASTHAAALAPTWMRPRRMPLPDDDDKRVA